MSHDPLSQPQQPPTPPAPQGAYPPPPPAPQGAYPPPPPAAGGYAPAPYAAPGYAYGPPVPAAIQGREFADWGTRLGAAIIDGLFIVFTLFIGYIVNFFLMGREGEKNGMSLGKQVCNIRVVKEDGQPVTAGYAVLREFVIKGLLVGTIGGFFFIPWLVNYLWPLWDERKQALHDKLGSSYVVRA